MADGFDLYDDSSLLPPAMEHQASAPSSHNPSLQIHMTAPGGDIPQDQQQQQQQQQPEQPYQSSPSVKHELDQNHHQQQQQQEPQVKSEGQQQQQQQPPNMNSMMQAMQQQFAPLADQNQPHALYVGNLTWWTTDQELHEMFSKYGRIVDLRIYTDKVNGKSKGFAFLEYDPAENGAMAGKQHIGGTIVNGRPVTVNFVTLAKMKQIAMQCQQRIGRLSAPPKAEESRGRSRNKPAAAVPGMMMPGMGMMPGMMGMMPMMKMPGMMGMLQQQSGAVKSDSKRSRSRSRDRRSSRRDHRSRSRESRRDRSDRRRSRSRDRRRRHY